MLWNLEEIQYNSGLSISISFDRWTTSRRLGAPTFLSTIITNPGSQSNQKLVLWRRWWWIAFAGMIGRKPMLETDFDLASFASAGVRKCQYLPAPLHRASRLLLLLRITFSRLLMPLQNQLLFFSVVAGDLNWSRTSLAYHNFSAIVIRFRAFVSFARSMIQAENLMQIDLCLKSY